MSTIALQDRIRALPVFRSGETFYAGMIAAMLRRRKSTVSNDRINQALRDMAQNGELVKVDQRYRKTNTAALWLSRSWRRHTDEQLGIVA